MLSLLYTVEEKIGINMHRKTLKCACRLFLSVHGLKFLKYQTTPCWDDILARMTLVWESVVFIDDDEAPASTTYTSNSTELLGVKI